MKVKKWVFLLFFLIAKLCFIPQIVEVQLKIAELQAQNRLFSQKRQKRQTADESIPQKLQKYQTTHINYNLKCKFNGENYQGFLFQTASDIYLAMNIHPANQIKIYNSQCNEISVLNNFQIHLVLSDRGMAQLGTVYFITKDYQLFHIRQENTFQNAQKLATLKAQSHILGAIVRYRGKDRAQIFIVYENGVIAVYDESGSLKFELNLQGSNSQISSIADHHPYPFIVTKLNWISLLDTNKYVQISQNCPSIPNIRYILAQSYYGQSIFIISAQKILIVHFDLPKKSCTIKSQYNLNAEIGQIRKASYYKHTLFLDDMVYNMTQRKLYKQPDCHGQQSIEFVTKKNPSDQQFCLKMCCQDRNCSVEYFEMKKSHEDKSAFIWMAVSFIIIICVALSLMKKSTVSNMDIDGREKQLLTDKRINEISKRNRQKNNKLKKK